MEMIRSIHISIIGIISLILPFCIRAQTLEQSCERFIRSDLLNSDRSALLIQDLSADSILFSFNEDTWLSPASILKIVTISSAYQYLGNDYQFETGVQIKGLANSDILDADIHVRGGGDPSLNTKLTDATQIVDIADDIAEFLSQYNVSCMNGQIIVDASHFKLPGHPDTYIHEDMANYYGSGIYGLNVNENSYDITFMRNTKSRETEVVYYDKFAIDFVINDVKYKGNRDLAYIFSTPQAGVVAIKGSIPDGKGAFTIKGAIPNPPLYFAAKLQDHLMDLGIEMNDDAIVEWQSGDDRDITALWHKTYGSAPFESIVTTVLHKSHNMMSETLEREMSLLPEYIEMKNGLSELYPGLKLKDGSGLSPANRLSCRFMLDRLKTISESEWGDEMILNMPRNGMDGTVANLLNKEAGYFRIKSGSSSDVLSYAGYYHSKNGNLIGFCFIANEIPGNSFRIRKEWEKLMERLSKE